MKRANARTIEYVVNVDVDDDDGDCFDTLQAAIVKSGDAIKISIPEYGKGIITCKNRNMAVAIFSILSEFYELKPSDTTFVYRVSERQIEK